jgi:hypothetical protein
MLRALDHGDTVRHLRVEVGRKVDRLQLALGRLDVGDVDEPGVDRSLRDLAHDAGDVGLVGAHVAEDRRLLIRRQPVEHLAGVGADRHRLRAHRDRRALLRQVRQALHGAVGRHGEHQFVGREDDRLLDQAGRIELVRQLGVGRGEHIGLDALADLGGELIRARERRAHLGRLEVLGVAPERVLQRGRGGDGQLRFGAGGGGAGVV